MNKVAKRINSFTIWLLGLYLFHLGVEPFLNYFGLSDIVFYTLPIFVAFSTCYLFIKSLKSEKLKDLFELGFVFLLFVFLIFGVNKYSRIMSFIANPTTDSYLLTLINTKSNEHNAALSSNDHEKSRQIAHYYYSEFGLKIPFKTKESIYVPFEPTKQEIADRSERLESMAKDKETILLAANNAKNYEWMTNYLLISFSVSFILFTCMAVYRQNKL